MDEKFRKSPLAISVLTGVTVLVGGIEPVIADIIPLSQPFGTIANDTNSSSDSSGSQPFSGSFSDPTPFSRFDAMGGTRELTGVSVIVTSLTSLVLAAISGNCASSLSEPSSCEGSATNATTFSVAIGLGGPLTPSTQVRSATAEDSCIPPVIDEPAACEYVDSASNVTLPGQFIFTATVPQLSLFVGLGTFNVTPQLSLGGGNIWDHGAGSFENSVSATAQTQWSGTIGVTYEFRVVGEAPEPASLLLLGAGLAGLGFARRKKQHS